MSLWLTFSTEEAEPYNLDYIDLEEAVRYEARTIAEDAGSELLDDPGTEARDELENEVFDAAMGYLVEVGDSYTDPTDVVWRLVERDD